MGDNNNSNFWNFMNDNAFWVFIAFIVLVEAVVKILHH